MSRETRNTIASARCRGSALLEVMVALVLLGVAGDALIMLMGQSAQSLRQVREREIDFRRASDELARISAYDRTQLLASNSRSLSRGWIVSVAQTSPDLFDVIVADTITQLPMLRTTLYRPDTVGDGKP